MEYTALSSFLAGYLHQDWDAEYANPVAAAADFGTVAPLDVVCRALGEGSLLLAAASDVEVADQLKASGCYVVAPEGSTPTEWLRSILAEIAKAASTRA